MFSDHVELTKFARTDFEDILSVYAQMRLYVLRSVSIIELLARPTFYHMFGYNRLEILQRLNLNFNHILPKKMEYNIQKIIFFLFNQSFLQHHLKIFEYKHLLEI